MIDAVSKTSYQEAERLIAEVVATGAFELNLDCLRIDKLPASLGKLTSLKSLNLSRCHWLEDINVLGELVNLQSLDLCECAQIADFSALGKITALQSLNLHAGEQITDLTVLLNLTTLKSLQLHGCENITDISMLANLTSLTSLYLRVGDRIDDLSVLADLTDLRSLTLHLGAQIDDISVLASFTELQLLAIYSGENISDLSALANLTALQSLDLNGCGSLTDFSVLKNLVALRSLEFGWNSQITDLTALANLRALRSLELSGCNQVTDLSTLTSLTELQSLSLRWCSQIADLSVIAKLTALHSLNLSGCNQLTDLSVIAKLTALQSLSISSCEKLTDFSALINLTNLQTLNFTGCKQFTDLSALAKLTALQSIDLHGCVEIIDISILTKFNSLQQLSLNQCEKITDLSALTNLTELQSLSLRLGNELDDLSVLANLTALQSLTIGSCTKITDFSVLANLRALRSLGLDGCSKGGDVAVLGNLSALEHLSLEPPLLLTNQIPLGQLRNLRSVFVYGIEESGLAFLPPRLVELYFDDGFSVNNAPSELFSGGFCDNALENLIPWQRDIYTSGAAPNTELKLFVLGNGRVGKTQIVRRLQNQVYDPNIASTHGVALGRFEVLGPEDSKSEMHANLWDFGGQDVYMGTHGLFLDERAVYVVVWHPNHESDIEYYENGVPMHNRPLGYWLAYIRSLAGADAPIIVVQSQCDQESSVAIPPLPVGHGFRRLRVSSCSAKTSYGMEQLWPEIRSAARLLRDRYAAVQIPKSWVAVSEKLRELHAAGEKALSFSNFVQLCHAHSGLRHPDIVAGYLHRAGQVFWREGAFANQLLLDQVWALEGIYALLDRGEILPRIRENHGRFSLWDLQKTVWNKYGITEQKLFIDMMQQCGACFPLGDDRYIAAELLPSERQRRTDIDAIWRDAKVAARVELHYEFLHDGIIKAILCEIGRKAGNAGVYWRSGVCYFDREARGAVRIGANWLEGQADTRHGIIVVEVEGPHAGRIAEHLAHSIESIRIGAAPQVIWCSGQPSPDENARRQSVDDDKLQVPFAGVAPDPNLGGRTDPMQVLDAEPTKPAARQRILLMATEWRSNHGGLSTFNRELCLALAQLDNDVFCAVAEASEDDIAKAREKNVTLIKARAVASGDPIQGLSCKLPLPADFRPDVIIGHGRITGQAAKIQREDHFPKAKRIHFIHMAPGEIEWFKGKKDAAQLAALRDASELHLAQDACLVAAVGPRLLRETATLIDRLEPEKRPKIVQFNPGFTRIESRPSLPHNLHCLMLGRTEDKELKGVDIAASAIQQIDCTRLKHKPELIIRGAPVDTGTSLRNRLAKDHIGLVVRVKEYSTEEGEIEADFRSAALALMPSRREGFGLVALEALSVGTPVLVSQNSGFAELLEKLMEPYELVNYIVETPDDVERAAQNWRDKIFDELRDVDASMRRAKKLADILDEALSWRTSCEYLMTEASKVAPPC